MVMKNRNNYVVDAGDWAWDFITGLCDYQSTGVEKEVIQREALQMIDGMLERDRREIEWLKKMRKVFE